MELPEDERRKANQTGELVKKKMLAIMDLQADVDALLRESHPTPFGSKNWEFASLEALQRLVAMTSIQFLLFEPVGLVKDNDQLKIAAEKMIGLLIDQLKTLKTKKSDW